MRPIIGIVVCGTDAGKQFVSQPYIDVIEHFGGCPILLPIISNPDLFTPYIHSCQGFLFCGGGDITSLLFGEPALSYSGTTDIKTDIFHLTLMEYALSSYLPILAICRGMQVLNVALGGTLYQDISLTSSVTYNHTQHSLNRSDVSHNVSFISGSMLSHICGDNCYTNSFHHQSVHALGENLRVTGTTKDGIVESIESTTHKFVLGVQWHPECMHQSSPEMAALFRSFLSAAMTL